MIVPPSPVRALLLSTAVCLLPAVAPAGTVVRFDTNVAAFDVELDDATMPITVANFLAYVNAGSYSSTLIHRSTTYDPTTIQIIQGGGFVLVGNMLDAVATLPPIVLESGTGTNVRGTIAMARTAEPNSATSQFFFNLADNRGLDGGYAVFGRVLGAAGLAALDAIGAVPVYDASQQLGSAFGELPLLAPSLAPANLVLVGGVSVVPEPEAACLAAAGLLAAAAARRRPACRRPGPQGGRAPLTGRPPSGTPPAPGESRRPR